LSTDSRHENMGDDEPGLVGEPREPRDDTRGATP
jgi:hypothetical protein